MRQTSVYKHVITHLQPTLSSLTLCGNMCLVCHIISGSHLSAQQRFTGLLRKKKKKVFVFQVMRLFSLLLSTAVKLLVFT